MSVASSSISQMSVSYQGSEVPLEEALDDCFHRLQESLNQTHYDTRALGMLPDQDDDFKAACELQVGIHSYIDDMTALFKELKKVVVQVRGKPANDEERQILARVQELAKQEKQNQALAQSSAGLAPLQ